jgi:hypothetical protein
MAAFTEGTSMTEIRAKRAKMTIGAIRSRHQAGMDTSNERAIVRVGQMSTQILIGAEDLSVWDDEELIRGQRRDKNGGWQGRAPRVVPKALHDELVRRTLAKAQEVMRENLVEAVQMLVEIVKGEDVEPKDRLKAIDMIMSRVMGKEPVKVDVDVQVSKFDEVIQGALVVDRSGILDVEGVEREGLDDLDEVLDDED